MTQREIETRQEKSYKIKVYKIGDNQFFVESSDKRKMYKVALGETNICTCEDFMTHEDSDPEWQCKHIIAIHKAANNGGFIDLAQTNGDKDVSQKHSSSDNHHSNIPSEFLVTLDGKEFILYKGLLDLAHKKGLKKLNVEIIQFPTAENKYEAIAKAIAESNNGEIFEDVGDANPHNVNSIITPHLLRMASTRAKARVLRDMVNVGICSVEELGDMITGSQEHLAKYEIQNDSQHISPNNKDSTLPASKQFPNNVHSLTQAKLSDAQLKAIKNISTRKGISEDNLNQMSLKRFGVKFHTISPIEASSFIQELQNAA